MKKLERSVTWGSLVLALIGALSQYHAAETAIEEARLAAKAEEKAHDQELTCVQEWVKFLAENECRSKEE